MIDFQAGAKATRSSINEASFAIGDSYPFIDMDGSVQRFPLFNDLPLREMQPEIRGVETDGSVQKIAVIIGESLSDYIHAVPALNALKRGFKHAQIVLVGRQWQERYLYGRPGPVSRVEVQPKNEEPQSVHDSYLDRMRLERFDLVIQIRDEGPDSNSLADQLGGRVTVGLHSKEALGRSASNAYNQLRIFRNLEIAALAGITPSNADVCIAVTEEDISESDEIVPFEEKPIAVLNPHAVDARRRWDPIRFAQVGDALYWAGARVVVIGDASEWPVAQQVAEAMKSPVKNTAGLLSLKGLTGLLFRSAVVISNNTGPLHLAAAVGTATVSLFWCADVMTTGPVTRSRHTPFISWQLHCPICGMDSTRSMCGHEVSFLDDISVHSVRDAAIDLLQKEAHSNQLSLPAAQTTQSIAL